LLELNWRNKYQFVENIWQPSFVQASQVVATTALSSDQSANPNSTESGELQREVN